MTEYPFKISAMFLEYVFFRSKKIDDAAYS